MIQTGDRFTHKDLTQSINELCGGGMQNYLGKSDCGVVIGESCIIPGESSPEKYASVCIREYQDIPSSAIYLDNQLRDKGFKTARRFAYKYNLGGLSAKQVIHDVYCLDWFLQICDTTPPHKKFKAEYQNLLDDAFRTSYFYAQYLWACNPSACRNIAQKLQMPNARQWKQIIGSILGVGFQFHPDDVYEYSIEHMNPTLDIAQFNARYAEQLEFKNKMERDYGIDTGCLVLSPNSREKLQKIVTRTDMPYWMQVIANLIPGYNR